MQQQKISLTVRVIDSKLLLYQLENSQKSSQVIICESNDGKRFARTKKIFSITNLSEKKEKLSTLSYLTISQIENAYHAIMEFAHRSYFAKSQDGLVWELGEIIPRKHITAAIVSPYSYQGKHLLYWAGRSLHLAESADMQSWQFFDDPIFEPYLRGHQTLHVLHSFEGLDEIFVPFVVQAPMGKITYNSLSVAIFTKANPRIVAWRFQYPIWSVPEHLIDEPITPLSMLTFKGKMYSFWQKDADGSVFSIAHPMLEEIVLDRKKAAPPLHLKKHHGNPILSPDATNRWESQAVFNPAAIYEDEKVHLLYRAVGDDWTSVLGYANSDDGFRIALKLPFPAYMPRKSFEGAAVRPDPNSPYTSGPGSGGCEDPRLTRIGDKLYLTYVAYNGWSGPRVALSSIDVSDFLSHNWNWSEPVIISKPGVIDKNACIFPEKIQGKYAIMHRVFPHILIDFVDSLDFDGKTFLQGEHKIAPRTIGWDSRKIGAGPPPIKTPYGWLLIYHAVDDKQDHKYQFGAMVLDLNDPTKEIHRSSYPIVSPTHWYENEGYKAGVVYPCGAVVIGDTLHVYYGGADTYICVATAPLTNFMEQLLTKDKATMNFLHIQ